MPRLPGHRYLGPGNAVRNGPPVDTDDAIARKHDLLYEIQPENVSAADSVAVDEFIEDFQRSGNFHSLIGGVGLQVKRSFENIYGQQYPMHRSHGGRDDYTYAIRELSKLWKENGKSGTWADFQKLHFGGLMREAHQKRKGAPLDGAEGSNKRHNDGRDSPVAGPSIERPSTSGGDTAPRDSEIPDDGYDMALRDFDLSQFGDGNVESMEAIANPAKGGGISGHSHKGSGGSGGPIMLLKTPRTPYYVKTYRKKWIFFSYGYAHTLINKIIIIITLLR
ncbi:uncharacterized protein LOC105431110 [Pogonomyrmex barbatus]|uniref:Uncharacterized protein LOC105431110 n=1 Tax=Pogonomyrmex barbatus TaxID=144034 RepID=A0A6I9WJV4_9HYME|nr:uncharacterized protein LOC105431110 [Pogonomyrmex barbatus]XP_011643398.1 uncharacterized protein LOC105431110 [Pogonomyrmex barbatus]